MGPLEPTRGSRGYSFVCKRSHFGLENVHVWEGVWDCVDVNVGMKG